MYLGSVSSKHFGLMCDPIKYHDTIKLYFCDNRIYFSTNFLEKVDKCKYSGVFLTTDLILVNKCTRLCDKLNIYTVGEKLFFSGKISSLGTFRLSITEHHGG